MAMIPAMARARTSPQPEVPGLTARRIAADILDGVLRRRIALDEQLSGKGAHPGLATLPDRDRALMRRLVATVLRRLGQLDAHLLGGLPVDADCPPTGGALVHDMLLPRRRAAAYGCGRAPTMPPSPPAGATWREADRKASARIACQAGQRGAAARGRARKEELLAGQGRGAASICRIG